GVSAPVLGNALPQRFEVLDFADPSVPTGVRNVSTVAPQALFLMNPPFILEQSRPAARQLLAEPGTDDQRITRAYRMALGRGPTDAEWRLGAEFPARASERGGARAQGPPGAFAALGFRSVKWEANPRRPPRASGAQPPARPPD